MFCLGYDPGLALFLAESASDDRAPDQKGPEPEDFSIAARIVAFTAVTIAGVAMIAAELWG